VDLLLSHHRPAEAFRPVQQIAALEFRKHRTNPFL
jgi:hypothetical protein